LTHSRETKQLRRDPTGTLIRTDGPFAETVEQLSGFYVVDTDDLDDLIDICGLLADTDGAVEIRAAVDHEQGDEA
jgi:hypothetical protein